MEKEIFEQTGLIPRSIIRTFNRFFKQLFPEDESLLLREFRISRHQVLVSVKCLVILVFVPIVINLIAKNFFLNPLIENFWNHYQNEIFLNRSQQTRALIEMQRFEDKVYFEALVQNKPYLQNEIFQQKFENKTIELALDYNKQSIEAITNLFSDFIALITIILLIIKMRSEIIILKSFLTESIYSLSDTIKSFLLILFTDLLVGFHSPRGWFFFLEILLRHFGFSENEDFTLLFVATFPVLLDTIFKYWIFRYLNKISPSTVVTYHNMIE